MNENIKKHRWVQITCPKCKFEFKNNLGAMELRKKELGLKLYEIKNELKKIKILPVNVKKEKQLEIRQLKKKQNQIIEELQQLKFSSQIVHNELNRQHEKLLKEIIKDFYGQKEFERVINELVEREKAYNVSDTMGIDYYSSTNGKHINKI